MSSLCFFDPGPMLTAPAIPVRLSIGRRLELDQLGAFGDLLSQLDTVCHEHTVGGCNQSVLHLHRLEHEQWRPAYHLKKR